MSRSERIPKLLSDLREARNRLDQALKDGALQRQLVADSCRVLRETLKAVRNGTRLYDHDLPHKARAPRADERLHRLTPREIEVLRLIAEGHSTKEIAHRMKISFKTAVSHRSHLLQKLGIHESASLVRLAIRAGLVSL
jgi:DNA-binding NarL/FixJ family response regulator